MPRSRPDYDRLAAVYDSRYVHNRLQGVDAALRDFMSQVPHPVVLEVGCGTGHWIETLRPLCFFIAGVDASIGMLQAARARHRPAGLVAALANLLPFSGGRFDVIYCVNALHHFDDPEAFVYDAAALLRPGGALALIGIDPRISRRRYFYDYFNGTLENDLARYPSFGQQMDWMARAGFEGIDMRVVDKYSASFRGRAVFDDPFLKKDSNSMLALLTDEQYNAGLKRIRMAVEHSDSPVFHSEMAFGMVTGSIAL